MSATNVRPLADDDTERDIYLEGDLSYDLPYSISSKTTNDEQQHSPGEWWKNEQVSSIFRGKQQRQQTNHKQQKPQRSTSSLTDSSAGTSTGKDKNATEGPKRDQDYALSLGGKQFIISGMYYQPSGDEEAHKLPPDSNILGKSDNAIILDGHIPQFVPSVIKASSSEDKKKDDKKTKGDEWENEWGNRGWKADDPKKKLEEKWITRTLIFGIMFALIAFLLVMVALILKLTSHGENGTNEEPSFVKPPQQSTSSPSLLNSRTLLPTLTPTLPPTTVQPTDQPTLVPTSLLLQIFNLPMVLEFRNTEELTESSMEFLKQVTANHIQNELKNDVVDRNNRLLDIEVEVQIIRWGTLSNTATRSEGDNTRRDLQSGNTIWSVTMETIILFKSVSKMEDEDIQFNLVSYAFDSDGLTKYISELKLGDDGIFNDINAITVSVNGEEQFTTKPMQSPMDLDTVTSPPTVSRVWTSPTILAPPTSFSPTRSPMTSLTTYPTSALPAISPTSRNVPNDNIRFLLPTHQPTTIAKSSRAPRPESKKKKMSMQ